MACAFAGRRTYAPPGLHERCRQSCIGPPAPRKRRHQDDNLFHKLMFVGHGLRHCETIPQPADAAHSLPPSASLKCPFSTVHIQCKDAVLMDTCGKNLRRRGVKPHPCSVRHPGPVSLPRPVDRGLLKFIYSLYRFGLKFAALLVICALVAPAQTTSKADQVSHSQASPATSFQPNADPPGLLYQGVPAAIPQDEGLAGLHLELLRLGTTARLMQVVAHPDDEDGGLLTLEARGHGVSTLLMTLNRGEGGQNKIGSNLSDVLGVLRTEELLASDQHYGIQDRFSRVADFGFSKNAPETFQKWGGHDVALADMVRVIRTFRPDVLVARFSGTDRDGHGNHQASSILTKEAFRAAADPKRFPEQIAQGLQPWQPKKFYIGNVCPWGSTTCADPSWTVKFNTGEPSPALKMSYVQFAMEGLRHQMSQGAANWTVEPGDRFTFYKLVDSVEPVGKNVHEKDFFDGIDINLTGLMSRLGVEGTNAPWLKEGLAKIAASIADANATKNPADAVAPLAAAVHELNALLDRLRQGGVHSAATPSVIQVLEEKRQQAETALNLALGVTLAALASSNEPSPDIPKEADAQTTVSPEQEFII